MGCGTLLQLVSYGSQDIYLTGNPQITFFKAVYKRHTNFTIESIEQVFTNNIQSHCITNSCIISKKGDLLYNMYLEIDLIEPIETDINNNYLSGQFVKRPGYALINYIELQIGGRTIDKKYGEWMDIWSQLTYTYEEYTKLKRMINASLVSNLTTEHRNIYKLYIPLQFWFCKNPGLALPLIALQFNEIKVNISFNPYNYITKNSSENLIHTYPKIDNIRLFCDYVFLDIEERRQFSKKCEYLIELVKFQGTHVYQQNELLANIKLHFEHPCKELIWLCQDNNIIQPGKKLHCPFSFNKGNNGGDMINNVRLLFNNNDRFKSRQSSYFRITQPYYHHNGGDTHDMVNENERGYIYTYSFALNPEELQPSGTCNFSRIDDPRLILEMNTSIGLTKSIRIYSIYYNILNITSGMGSLLYGC